MDFCRARMREERGLAGSIDEERSTGEGTIGRFDHELAEVARRISEGRFHAAIDLHAVAAALDELENDNMRAVLRLTLEGRRSVEIAEELELSVANVDQLRSRGIRRLNEALRAHD